MTREEHAKQNGYILAREPQPGDPTPEEVGTKVFHKRSFAQDNAAWPKDYIHVATVETADKECAFELTNHIDRPWHENKGVTTMIYSGLGFHRSTSVGDVVVLPDGTAFLCAGCGWEELAPANSE